MNFIEAYATCPKQLELLLKDEITALGGTEVREGLAGVHFQMTAPDLHKLVMWSRLANRILIKLGEQRCRDKEDLYAVVQQFQWSSFCRQLPNTLSIRFTGTNAALKNTHFSSQIIKDAVCDQLNEQFEQRPKVVKNDGHLGIYAHLKHQQLSVYQDITGHSLHQRGYRTDNTLAPLKENLAAAVLIRADWPAKAKQSYHLIDPMCGSGTLLLEGWAIASDLAPNLNYKSHSLFSWQHFSAPYWVQLCDEAEARHQLAAAEFRGQLIGVDHHKDSIALAEANSQRISGGERIGFHYQTLERFKIPPRNNLIVTNPPYGVRLQKNYLQSWRNLATWLRTNVREAQAAVLTPDESFGWMLGFKEQASYAFFNGRIPIQLRLFDVNKSQQLSYPEDQHFALPAKAQMVANRLKKNQARLANWLQQEDINCYRLYDADIPEYAVAIDCYHAHVVIQEYKPPKTIPTKQAALHLQQVVLAVQAVIQPQKQLIHLKTRQKQLQDSQYEKQDEAEVTAVVNEQGRRYLVDFETYLDTGLFLDHRWLRRTLQATSKNMKVLNLFCYTGSLSVAAALGGAQLVDSVDTSKTYLNWAKENFNLNQIKGSHYFIRSDVLTFLKQNKQTYDLIIADPPTFSNSHSRDQDWILQQHHGDLITACMAQLSTDGLLYFSNNFRKFVLDKDIEERFLVTDITEKSLDLDFKDSGIHRCFTIQHRNS